MEEKGKPALKDLLTNNIFSVSAYLTVLNSILGACEAKIKGEASEVKKWNSGHVYFSLKDKKDGSVLNCVIWNYDYRLCGLELQDGMEIIATGAPDIYKANGRLTFKAKTIRLVGEGDLKKQYEELKKKLESEGIFSEERKKPLPLFPKNIGVITSKQGAVINDFLNNLGRYGFKVKMIDSRVEGEEATKDLISAVKLMRLEVIDVLVIMRGGGSFESFLAFNNEVLIREIVDFPVPVIAALGHDKDVPLLALAADKMVSTPTAAANLLSQNWQILSYQIKELQNNIFNNFENCLVGQKNEMKKIFWSIENSFQRTLQLYDGLKQKICQVLPKMLEYQISIYKQKLNYAESVIVHNNPEKNLKLGYSLARVNGKIVRQVENVKIGDVLDLQVFNGIIASKVVGVSKIKK
ncbi:MAG TPA: exodeoxyribonuclease VII large subunit [Candidatus Pacearchaeota archaeon]|jgi:exodeoxyribonuclease VII large subunit|nr:exodeoxyribonuclease VII large subunit [Candidatus Pacearchaeota archaeon]HRR94603.1 exodeoxyribonuclease VII large subunit [Candidatus Paceibacterota bacterium]HPC30469.1 exodeoxyribonuclease VII large subunit [Candidatus Pacearchaeota archaeon]HQG09300.1 exodeoxyribonuclease VII large subunit [Candidatus Pacearchaeota archaeon]HQH19955.1 exodeoxyribonuclease VII large subunit [Candidatus Pacearchaeota archaeon]